MHKPIPLLILVALLAGCSGYSHVTDLTPPQVTGTTQESKVDAEEGLVYSALLNEGSVPNKDDRIIVMNQSSLEENLSGGGDLSRTLKYVGENMPVAQDVLDDLRKRNQQPQSLSCSSLRLGVECVLVSKEQLAELSRTGDFWQAFTTKYGGQGVITLSLIGFNREMNQALVYMGRQSDWKNGRGDYVLLAKGSNGWTIKHKVNVWVS